jgi:pyridinium-3,5-biscarboxylic acid mononucleotide sulfurtransferase
MVAFSGGLDSTFLLWAAQDALKDRVTAVTVSTPYMPAWEIKEASEFVESMGIRHKRITLPIIDEIRFNPDARCYLCKRHLFGILKEEAFKDGIQHVLDGTNYDDIKDYRPGMRALEELRVVSPLRLQGFTKEAIRETSRQMGIPNWQKPPYACLLSRIPYGREITFSELERIEKSERYLMDAGFTFVRVRSDGDLARIEFRREDRNRVFREDLLDDISKTLKGFGYVFVSMELEGYQMGSMNRTLEGGKY